MGKQAKIQHEMIPELTSLRQRIAELEQSEAEQKRKMDALTSSEMRLRIIMDNMGDIVSVIDVNGIVTFVTPSCRKILGYVSDEIVGRNAFEYLHPDDRERVIRSFARAMETVSEKEVFRIRHRDGQYILFEGSGGIIRDEKGSAAGIVVGCRDISKRMEIDESLLRSEKEIYDLYNNAPCGYHSLDKDGLIIRINDTELRWVGYSRDEVIGEKKFSDLLTSKSAEEFRKNFALFKEYGETRDLKYELLHKDGTIRPVLLSATAVTDHNGNYLMSRSILYDITERKRMEEIRQEGEERFRRLADVAWEGIIIHREGIILDANESVLRMFGHPAEEVIGQNVLMFLSPESIEPALQKLKESINKPQIYFEAMGLRKDKTIISIEILGKPIRYNDLDARVIAIRDISERKRIEKELKRHHEHLEKMVQERTVELQTTNEQLRQASVEHKRAEKLLRESEEKYRVLSEGSIHGILAADLETGRFKYANPSICRMFGYSETELLQLGVDNIHPKDALVHVKAAFELLGRGGMALAPEIPCLRKDGTVFYADITDSKSTISGRECVVGFFMDATDRRGAEKEIQALNEELQNRLNELLEARALEEEAKRAKSEFLANISHEITTPLNSIIGFSRVLLEKIFGDLNEKQQGYLENVLNSGERLHETLKNIVSFVSMDVSNPEMDWEEFRLKDIVDSSLSIFRKATTDRHLTMTLQLEKEADRLIRADRAKLIQVFHNLLSNAAKFSREAGKITISGRHQKGSEQSGTDDLIEITVADTGIGIKAEDLPRLFLPFQQLEGSLTKKFAGAGMGLMLAKRLIEAHGGAIRVESDYGKGTKVIFTIPVEDGQKK